MTDEAGQDPSRTNASLRTIALWVVILSGMWYLLGALGELLKPLLLAAMSGYVILPFYLRLKDRFHRVPAMILMGLGSVGIAVACAALLSASVMELRNDWAGLSASYRAKKDAAIEFLGERIPWVKRHQEDLEQTEIQTSLVMNKLLNSTASIAASALGTAVVVSLYLLFMLMEAGRLPVRLKRAFPGDHSERISSAINAINRAMIEYINGKVLSNLVLAVPVFIVLVAFGVKLAAFWGVLTFLCNFIPYIGTVIACGLPLIYGFLTIEPVSTFAVMAGLLLTIHLMSSMVVEPMILGKALGMSPLLILFALSFWGSVWGFEGMLLAIPLTSMGIIILDNIPATKPLAVLMSE